MEEGQRGLEFLERNSMASTVVIRSRRNSTTILFTLMNWFRKETGFPGAAPPHQPAPKWRYGSHGNAGRVLDPAHKMERSERSPAAESAVLEPSDRDRHRQGGQPLCHWHSPSPSRNRTPTHERASARSRSATAPSWPRSPEGQPWFEMLQVVRGAARAGRRTRLGIVAVFRGRSEPPATSKGCPGTHPVVG